MHTQRIYEHHESESQLPLYLFKTFVHGVCYIALYFSLCSPHQSNVIIHNEGIYISFPSYTLKPFSLHIQFYLLALTTINAFYLLRTRENHSRYVYIIQRRSFLMASFKMAHQLQEKFKICAGACPAVFFFHAGSLDVGDAPASIFVQGIIRLE
jgi:hypothetical protein